MNPRDYEIAFQIIGFAGNARSSAMMAIRAAREGDFAEAKKLLEDADRDLHEAHGVQSRMLTQEARGDAVPVTIILVHAQDHLAGALLVRDLADEVIEIHKTLAAAKA